jgi:hypothetical protein
MSSGISRYYDLIHMGGGESYAGQLKAGLFDGTGNYSWPSGSIFIGEWVDGGRHGLGLLIAVEGEKYDPNAMNNVPWSKNTPFSILVNQEGRTRYEGEWRFNRKNGYGVYIYPDGSQYVGMFNDDKLHGQGMLFDSNGEVLAQGQWLDGNFIDSQV